MTPEEFRVAGHALIDWIVDFRTGLPELPVQSDRKPGDIRSAFPVDLPAELGGIEELLSILDTIVVPGMTHVQHPRFFGFFPSNAGLASVLGDLASSGLGGLGITWQSCPALTEVEEVVCDWMRRLVGLSGGWKGTIYDTASSGALVAMLCARERATGYGAAGGGLQAEERPLAVYCTTHSHSSVTKAAALAGYGATNVRFIDVDPTTYAMVPEALAAAMAEDAKAGTRPAIVVATVGTTGTTAVDPVAEIVEIAQHFGAWVHVDAALAGAAMLLEDQRHLWAGVEGADSLSWNPHKWLGTVLDVSLFYIRDLDHLIRVMSTNPSYLRSSVDGEATQYRDWGIPLGRRFRSLKLLFQLRIDGVESIRQRLRRDLDNAQRFSQMVAATPGWKVLAPVPLQTICLRHEPLGVEGDALDAYTLGWAAAVNDGGGAYLTTSKLDDRWMVRVSIGSENTQWSDVEEVWRLIQQATGARLSV